VALALPVFLTLPEIVAWASRTPVPPLGGLPYNSRHCYLPDFIAKETKPRTDYALDLDKIRTGCGPADPFDLVE
jgi:hypothetical protein